MVDFCQREFDSLDGQALEDLGQLRWSDDLDWARAAFERAIGLGNQHALVPLVLSWRGAAKEGRDIALTTLHQRITAADPEVAAEGLVELAQAHVHGRELPMAEAAFREAIATRHPHFASMAMIGLGHLTRRFLGDEDGADALFRQAIESGDADCRANGYLQLAKLRHRRGEVAEAKDA